MNIPPSKRKHPPSNTLHTELEKLLVEGINIGGAVSLLTQQRRSRSFVNSPSGGIEGVVKLRDRYIIWRDGIVKFLNNNHVNASWMAPFLQQDKVLETCFRGVGLSLNDPFTIELIGKIERCANEKVRLLSDYGKECERISKATPTKIVPVSGSRIKYDGKLKFYPADGTAKFGGVTKQFPRGKKGYELLALLLDSKNMPFTVSDLGKYCNHKIRIEKHRFKAVRDVRDTINEIRKNLKVEKGEFFPIDIEANRLIWREK